MAVFHYILLIIIGIFQIITAGHALLYKRDPRAAWAWIVTCLLLPPFGPLLYCLLGINRVRTRAKRLKWYWPWFQTDPDCLDDAPAASKHTTTVCDFLTEADFHTIAQVSDAVTRKPLLGGNSLQPLFDGEEAYPAMLQAIREAREYIFLSTFIFDSSRIGHEFIQALEEAKKRSLDIRVLIDGIGEFYTWPRVSKALKDKGIPFTRFLPPKLNPPSPFINLRNHRKILVVDGEVGFTGGMNLGLRHMAWESDNHNRTRDLHFRVYGPIVNQIEEVFLEDWAFCTGDFHQKPKKPAKDAGQAVCRSITVGPNQDLNKLSMILTGCVSLAKERISIMTPYFLPTRELIGALQGAALKGVEVDIVLPAKNNLPFVHWATQNMLWELLQCGVRVFYQPPPFCHSKLFLIDTIYAQIGSANLDPRSLRLNFELVVEIFDRDFVQGLQRHMDETISQSRQTSLVEVDSRTLPVRLRDSVFWLFSPYF